MKQTIKISKKEQAAIRELELLAARWPKTLSLFSWSGYLTVMKEAPDGRLAVVKGISGIDNDGGDPSTDEADQDAKVVWA